MGLMKNFELVFWDAVTDGSGGGGEVDLGAVISGAIGEVEGGGGGEPAAAATPDPQKEEEEKELAALEAEIRSKNPAMRGNIAIHRHQAVLTRTRNQHEKLAKEWSEKEKAWQESEKRYKTDLEGWGKYEWAKHPDIQLGLQALDLSERDPRAFAELLLSDPRYAQLLKFADAETKQEVKQALADKMPGPNKRSEDGKFEYYDNEGFQAALQWQADKLRQEAAEERKQLLAEMEKSMEQKYGSVAKAYEASTLWNNALNENKQRLDQIREQWPGFKEHEKDIKALIMANIAAREKDPRVQVLPIEMAYIQAVPAKLQQATQVNEQAIREKVLKELQEKKAAAGAVVKPTGVERGGEQGNRDLADVIRASLPRE